MGRAPFPPLPTVIGARPLVLLNFFNIHIHRGRRLRAPQGLPSRLPRPIRSTAPALNTIHLVKERFTGAKKNPVVCEPTRAFCRSGRFDLLAFQTRCQERLTSWIGHDRIHANPRSSAPTETTAHAGTHRR